MFAHLSQIPRDPIFELLDDFNRDPRKEKINLGIGIYMKPDGSPFVFPSIEKAASEIALDDFNYQPMGGNLTYLDLTAKLIFGDGVDTSQLACVSTCGGTQACSVFDELAVRMQRNKMLVGTPTWANHWVIFKNIDFQTFDHLDEDQNVNFPAYQKALQEAEPRSLFLLQGGQTHNPIGKNISIQQLQKLLPLIVEKDIFLFVDFAYMGMGKSVEEDRKFVQVLYENLENFAVGFSYSKNASLYEQRTGALFIKTKEKELVESNLKNIIRGHVSNCPGFGQKIIVRLLQQYQDQWLKELQEVQADIAASRQLFVEHLPELQYLAEGQGMFGLIDITKDQVIQLREAFGVYLIENGRINFPGVKPGNIQYIAESLRKVL